MMTGITRLCLAILAAILAAPAIAQTNCEAILRDGVFDISSSTSTRTANETLLRYVCNRTASSTGFGGSYAGYGISYDQSRVSRSCENFHRTRSTSTSDVSYFREANQALVAAWSSCVDAGGLTFSLSQSSTPARVRGIINWRSQAVPAADARIVVALPAEEFTRCECDEAANGACTPTAGGLSISMPSGARMTFRCDRVSSGPVQAGLTSDQGNREARLPALTMRPALFANASPIPTIAGRCSWPAGGGGATMAVVLVGEDLPPTATISFVSRGPQINYSSFVALADFANNNGERELTAIPTAVGQSELSRRTSGLWASTQGIDPVRIIAPLYRDCDSNRAVNRIARLQIRLERRDILALQ